MNKTHNRNRRNVNIFKEISQLTVPKVLACYVIIVKLTVMEAF